MRKIIYLKTAYKVLAEYEKIQEREMLRPLRKSHKVI